MDGSAFIFLRVILGPRLLDIWTFGGTCLAPSFVISRGFLISSTCISVANLFSIVFVFDSGFGVVLELNNTLQLFG